MGKILQNSQGLKPSFLAPACSHLQVDCFISEIRSKETWTLSLCQVLGLSRKHGLF